MRPSGNLEPTMSFLTVSRGSNSARHFVFGRTKEPDHVIQALLTRMRQHWYAETLPVLASYWLKTVCGGGHNRVWWEQLNRSLTKAVRDQPLDASSRAVLLSVQNWIRDNILRTGRLPAAHHSQPPYRSLPPERLIPYVTRLLNEWLPAELARLLTNEAESIVSEGDGISGLAVAKAFDRLLARERLSLETLEMLIAPGLPSPKLVYSADAEIFRDVVLAHLGRVDAPPSPVLPAVLLGTVESSAFPHDYAEAVHNARLMQTDGGETLHVPIAAVHALEIVKADPVRIGSVVVTMDGRIWQSSALHTGDENAVVYAPGGRLSIDSTSDHARLTVPWPEAPTHWTGAVPLPGPFEIFGREWHGSSWEIRPDAAFLHLTFSRVLPIPEMAPEVHASHLRPAYVDMAWSELERALSDSLLRRNLSTIEDMRRTELIPLGRALYGLIESLRSNWLL